jgi:hypothetical protein
LPIERTFRFRNFREAFENAQQVAELAEAEGHHPDISFGWGYVTVVMQTKKIKGLHEMISSGLPRLTDYSNDRTPNASRGAPIEKELQQIADVTVDTELPSSTRFSVTSCVRGGN